MSLDTKMARVLAEDLEIWRGGKEEGAFVRSLADEVDRLREELKITARTQGAHDQLVVERRTKWEPLLAAAKGLREHKDTCICAHCEAIAACEEKP